MIYINQFFFDIFEKIRKIYLNSKVYDNKISKVDEKDFIYKPSPYLLSSLIKYQKKKFKIEDFSLDKIWNNNELSQKEFKNLNSFYWFFSLDLKSSKKDSQLVISNWINNNYGPFTEEELNHRMTRYGLNPCGEILGNDFHCNLAEVHLNQIAPDNIQEQKKAFKAAALSVACLLNHKF